MTKITSLAKINLYLKVLGRREDGFHNLATVFQTIDLCDDLEWLPGDSPLELTVRGAPDFGSDNLIRRAIQNYQDAAGLKATGRLTLIKRIPIGGGLGGGSSNAAAILGALNRRYKKLSPQQLSKLALGLGSDVPFFLVGGCQWGFGRGEQLEKCHWQHHHAGGFLFLPPFGIPTAAVFKSLRAGAYVPAEIEGVKVDSKALGHNDLEKPACEVAPNLRPLLAHLKNVLGDATVFMSGSGSTIVWLTDKSCMPEALEKKMHTERVRVLPFRFVGNP